MNGSRLTLAVLILCYLVAEDYSRLAILLFMHGFTAWT